MRTSSRSRAAAAALALLAATGCPSLGTRLDTTPLPAGGWQLGASLDAAAYRDREQATTIPTLPIELWARRGLGRDLDLGFKLFTVGSEVSLRWRVRSGPWALAVVPALQLARTDGTGVLPDALNVFASLPLVVGHALSARTRVLFGPRLVYGYFLPVTGGSAHGLLLGAHVGLDLRFGRARRWHFLPELVTAGTAFGEVPVKGGILQLGVGFARDF